MPDCQDLLGFLNFRAQASETSLHQGKKSSKPENQSVRQSTNSPKQVALFALQHKSNAHCSICKNEKNPLYACLSFKAMRHDGKVAVLKEKKLCTNCLKGSH